MTKSQQIAMLQADMAVIKEFHKAALQEFLTPVIVKQIATQTFLEQQAQLELLRDQVTKILNAICIVDASGVLRQKLNEALK